MKNNMLEEFEELFGNTPFENIKKIKEYINKNFVSKDKIKDKIEESYNRKFSDFTNECNFAVEKVLKKLLED